MTPECDIVCFSHLRWDFVYQRPQHLLSRFARERRVFFVEEPRHTSGLQHDAYLDVSLRERAVRVLVPHVPPHMTDSAVDDAVRTLLDDYLISMGVRDFVAWYYTPMALDVSRQLTPLATVYDCMDELSAFSGAPTGLLVREQELFSRADLVFTGGHSLYEAKVHQHHSVHLFPSSVDTAHFARARQPQSDPEDQAAMAHPRIGFYGVLDERLDCGLLDGVARRRPHWQLVLIGPIAKIHPATLPRRHNIHYLGAKDYAELPRYLAGWDAAVIPFARNEATRFISPTKTPEYLAAGRPVVSTSIRDVVQPYAVRGLVRVADTPDAFVTALEEAFAENRGLHMARSDEFLSDMSWDATWAAMGSLLKRSLDAAESVAAVAA